jgi:hypothetical protein
LNAWSDAISTSEIALKRTTAMPDINQANIATVAPQAMENA